ncbi:MAG: hypothetical protein IPJ65_12235 [Archangiaceae bacterium]|nr:hypothetical protein [Archangiaceae bacterium]
MSGGKLGGSYRQLALGTTGSLTAPGTRTCDDWRDAGALADVVKSYDVDLPGSGFACAGINDIGVLCLEE